MKAVSGGIHSFIDKILSNKWGEIGINAVGVGINAVGGGWKQIKIKN